MDLVPDYCNEANIATKKVVIFFAGGVSCLQFVKNVTPMKQHIVKQDKRRYAYI